MGAIRGARLTRWEAAKFLVAIALAAAPGLARGEEAILRVIVGTVDRGDRVVDLTPDGDVHIALPDFRKIGFNPPPREAVVPDPGRVSLRSLAPDLSFELDRNRALLHIDAATSLLKTSELNLGFSQPASLPVRTREPAVFVTGQVAARRNTDQDRTEIYVPWDLTASAGRQVLSSGFNYRRSDDDSRLVRFLTQWTWDTPERMERLRAGDVNAASGRLGGAATLGGVSLSRAFFMQPSFRPYPGRELQGTVQSPSRVEVYANGVLLGRRDVLPGEFVIRGLPSLAGAAEVEIVVTDESGNREVIRGSYYNSTRVLREGLQDYSYSLGFVREGLGSENFDYGRFGLIGFHRVGKNDRLTIGSGLELSRDRWNLAPELTWNLDPAGELSLTTAASGDGADLGAGFAAEYQYAAQGFSLNAGLRSLSRHYSNLSRAADEDKERLSLRLGGGLQGRRWGAASATVSFGWTHEGADISTYSASYSKTLSRTLSLFARATRVDDEEGEYHNFFLGIRGLLGKGRTTSVNYSTQNDQKALDVRIKEDLPTDDGFGFDAGAGWLQNGDEEAFRGDAALRYQTRYGIASATAREDDGNRTYGAEVAGSISWVGNAFHLSRPIYDSFALVKVGEAPDVRVYRNHQPYGTTGQDGELLVAGLSSYSVNSVGIEVTDLPVRYRMAGAPIQALVPAYRSGARIEVPAETFQAITGRAYLVREDGRVTADYAAIEVRAPNRTLRSVVGRGGEFYLEDLPPGRHPVRFTLRSRSCETTMNIPEREELLVDIGEVSCEIR